MHIRFCLFVHLPSQSAIKATKALIFGDSYVFSTKFIKDFYERMENDLDTISFSDEFKVDKSGQKETIFTSSDFNDTVTESRSNSNKQTSNKGLKKKKGKSNTNSILYATRCTGVFS